MIVENMPTPRNERESGSGRTMNMTVGMMDMGILLNKFLIKIREPRFSISSSTFTPEISPGNPK